jgi:UDP:flavonoid glycosyltransferase YjiC (YdhE family)
VSKRIVITCWGSHGDLFPYIGLALALKRRGHSPVVATMPLYQPNVERENLEFAAVGPTVDVTDLGLFERVMDPGKGSEVIVRELLLPKLRDTYEQLAKAAAGADFVVSHPICYATPVFAERERLPWVSTTLAPMLFFSRTDPSVMPMLPRINSVPLIGPWLARQALELARRTTRAWMQPVARLRRELGLDEGAHPLFEGQFSPFGTLALHSRLLATPQPDWPPNVTITGCVFYNGPDALDARLENFLAAGPPPVVFTLGTSAVGAAGRFYHESAAAVQKIGMRAVLLTGGIEQNQPEGLPDTVLLVDRAPHQLLFPRVAAVVHQVGAGTLGQALRSGKPMLLVPHGHDQFDNAFRTVKLGVARTLFPKQYTAERVARELATVLDASYRRRAEEAAAVVRQEGGAEAAATAIEALLG